MKPLESRDAATVKGGVVSDLGSLSAFPKMETTLNKALPQTLTTVKIEGLR